jgi:PHD/YefM family antitoxin component YafN of YafNO toxin-antitoxin module
MPISKARKGLTTMQSSLRDGETVAVTSHGREVLAVMRWDLYESISETLEILGDPGLMRELKRSIREARAGRLIPLAKVKEKSQNYDVQSLVYRNRREDAPKNSKRQRS